MNFSSSLLFIGAFVAVSGEKGTLGPAKAPSLWEVFGDAPAVKYQENWMERSMHSRAGNSIKSTAYRAVRSADNCAFPLDVVIVQDATASFADDFDEMRNNQLPKMYEEIEKRHPGSRYGLVSFQDKPKWTLGDAHNYCHSFDVPLTSNYTEVAKAYEKLSSYAGGDMQENQMGAIFAAAASERPGWSDNSIATKLIILVTDAHPHFAEDKLNLPEYKLRPFEGRWDDADADFDKDVCENQYYASPDDAVRVLKEREAYLAVLAAESDGPDGLVAGSWKWFNNYAGQVDAFYSPLSKDSDNFWTQLAKVLEVIGSAECRPTEPTTPPSAKATTAISATETPDHLQSITGNTVPVNGGLCYPGVVKYAFEVKNIPVKIVAEDFDGELSVSEVMDALEKIRK